MAPVNRALLQPTPGAKVLKGISITPHRLKFCLLRTDSLCIPGQLVHSLPWKWALEAAHAHMKAKLVPVFVWWLVCGTSLPGWSWPGPSSALLSCSLKSFFLIFLKPLPSSGKKYYVYYHKPGYKAGKHPMFWCCCIETKGKSPSVSW